MGNVLLDYGDGKMSVELPNSATVVRYGQTYVDPPEVDAHSAVAHLPDSGSFIAPLARARPEDPQRFSRNACGGVPTSVA